MTKRIIALAIADALLAGKPDLKTARRRCDDVLGNRARWIVTVVREMLKRFSNDRRDSARYDLAKAISASPAFNRA